MIFRYEYDLFFSKLEILHCYSNDVPYCPIRRTYWYCSVLPRPGFPTVLIYVKIVHAVVLIRPHSSQVIHITTKWVWWFLVAKAIYSC